MKPINTVCGQNKFYVVKVDGTYSYHYPLKGQDFILFYIS
jgi:hypothetical protein